MKPILRSYVRATWHRPEGGSRPLLDPCTEEVIAEAPTAGVDFGGALDFARRVGGPALRELTFAGRGELLRAMSAALQDRRDELLAVSLLNTGATRRDAKFDVDGGIHALAYYAELGAALGQARVLPDGEGLQLGRSPRFWGQHVWVPLAGAAVHVNAFNFPVWGFAEKAACALLAGVPVVTKPATSSALVAERAVAAVVERGVLPPGALSLVCGPASGLLDELGPVDALAFTGSAATALALRGTTSLLRSGTRVNVEADSLNAAVLGPDAAPEGATWSAFVRDVVREMTQKTGQKCTAVRRIFVPRARLAPAREALVERLRAVVVGHPEDESVTMGPLATAEQLRDAESGVACLGQDAALVLGEGRRIDGVGAPPGRGYFFGPTLLLRADEPALARRVHTHEVFGPVAALLAYDGTARAAAELVALAEGTLVTSVYSDDREFLAEFLARAGATTGRLYIGSERVADQLPGSGVALPQVQHGGPGRAGGGQELGGLRGLQLYLQRVALTGERALVARLSGTRDEA
jgi:oxepin-CoA hydrolase/3-oxo-5,6-dehydrosuberyl-CoA semialdehyde dehydrogenase